MKNYKWNSSSCSSTASWEIPEDAVSGESKGWHLFRIQQNGSNASGQTFYLSVSGFEVCGKVTGALDKMEGSSEFLCWIGRNELCVMILCWWEFSTKSCLSTNHSLFHIFLKTRTKLVVFFYRTSSIWRKTFRFLEMDLGSNDSRNLKWF